MINANTGSFVDQPCERCGSKKRVSKVRKETLATIMGTTSTVLVSQITCTNRACQELFNKNRAEELARIDERKAKKDEADKLRKENIQKSVARNRETREAKK